MLYYVKTGDIEMSLVAKSHRQAAKKAVGDGSGCGILVVVNEKEINDDNMEENIYFLTEDLVDHQMRLVM